MVDAYLQPEVHIVITQLPGIDGAGTTAQLAQIESDLATMLARPVITELDDVPNVNAATPSSGQVLLFTGTNWEPGAVGGTIASVFQHPSGTPLTNVSTIRAAFGLGTQDYGVSGTAFIYPVYGTAANTVAQGNHTHEVRTNTGAPFSASGTLSSGTREIVLSSITGLDPARSYVLTGDLRLDVRGEGTGAGRHTPSIRLSATVQARPDPVRTVSGVDRLSETTFDGITVSGVSSVTIRAFVLFVDGDPVYIGGGKLTVAIKPNR